MLVVLNILSGLLFAWISAYNGYNLPAAGPGPRTMRNSLVLQTVALAGSCALFVDLNQTSWPGLAISAAVFVPSFAGAWILRRLRDPREPARA